MNENNERLEKLIEQNNDLQRKQLIVHLFNLNVPQQDIRKIVGVDMRYITKLLKPLKSTKKRKDKLRGET